MGCVNTNLAPSVYVESYEILPPSRSIIFLDIDNPRPVPCFSSSNFSNLLNNLF